MTDFEKAIHIINELIEFIELPETQASVDGAADPEFVVAQSKALVETHKGLLYDYDYALQA